MAGDIAVLDSCVLYSAPLRDLLLRLALAGIYRARWSHRICEEWMRAVRRHRPDLKSAQLERTLRLMNAHVRECIVDGFESRIPDLSLPDEKDRHVLAAAIECRANLIVTFNVRHFPARFLRKHAVRAIHPDRFVSSLMDEDLESVIDVLREQRQALRNPPKSAREFLAALEIQQLKSAVQRLRFFESVL